MAIKQLQLRGISRTPSDRAVADGGCAESLNVHLDNAETAPVLPPEDASDEIYGAGESSRYPIIFIHKMSGKTVYIGKTTESGAYGFYAYGSNITNHLMGNTKPVPSGETVNHVASIGNTLIVFTDKNPYYYLFKDGEYAFMGSSIGGAAIEVVTVPESGAWSNNSIDIADGTLKSAYVLTTHAPDIQRWNDAKIDGDECHAELMETMDNVWSALIAGMAEKRNAGVFYAPFFLRYALRLYDGTYINTSTPILCGGHTSVDWATAYIRDTYAMYPSDQANWENFNMGAKLNNLFKVYVKGAPDLSDWSDIIKSIDFFVSDPIYAPSQEAGFESVGQRDSNLQCNITFSLMSSSVKSQTVKNEVLSKGVFYKIKSIDLTNASEMSSLGNGSMVISNADNVSGDTLYVQEQLPDSYRDALQYLPIAETMNFNGRLLLIGASEMLTRGDVFLNGQAATGSQALTVEMRFKIVNSVDGTSNHVMGHYYTDTIYYNAAFMSGGVLKHGNESATVSQYCDTYAWLAYPDTRCSEVEITYHYGSGVDHTYVVPMEKHPLLECAYVYLGMGLPIMGNVATLYPSGTHSASESRIMENPNKLMLSEFENPFLFPAGNIVTFKDKLIGAATVSVPLSEGQYGEYPLYAFTEGGIRVLVVNAEGTIAAANAHPNLSRHVALPGTILGMEQAVIFVTERGVMRLSGNQVTELSAAMIGPAYVLDDSLTNASTGLLIGSPWADIMDASENITLNEYMSQAKVAYDSKNYRLVFFRDGKPYQFVYKLDTQTWHKIYTGIEDARILNSYPECLVAYTSTAANVARFSNLPSAAMYADMTANHVYGIIATRPFDLDAPDIRKSINDIRIRGRYNRADVQYILLGSFDGINWKRLTSLRGGSYKVFRLVLLTKLTASERVTWIDVNYETRMTNKLR